MKRVTKWKPGTPLTEEQKQRLEALAKLPDDQIDRSDAPLLQEGAREIALRGQVHYPVKKSISLLLDADILAWLKKDGKGYQTRANQIFRERMLQDIGLR